MSTPLQDAVSLAGGACARPHGGGGSAKGQGLPPPLSLHLLNTVTIEPARELGRRHSDPQSMQSLWEGQRGVPEAETGRGSLGQRSELEQPN